MLGVWCTLSVAAVVFNLIALCCNDSPQSPTSAPATAQRDDDDISRFQVVREQDARDKEIVKVGSYDECYQWMQAQRRIWSATKGAKVEAITRADGEYTWGGFEASADETICPYYITEAEV